MINNWAKKNDIFITTIVMVKSSERFKTLARLKENDIMGKMSSLRIKKYGTE